MAQVEFGIRKSECGISMAVVLEIICVYVGISASFLEDPTYIKTVSMAAIVHLEYTPDDINVCDTWTSTCLYCHLSGCRSRFTSVRMNRAYMMFAAWRASTVISLVQKTNLN